MSDKDNETLRKTTIAFLKDFVEQGYENAVECIDWLEKQDESDETKAKIFLINKGYPIDANGIFPTYEEMHNIIREGLENQATPQIQNNAGSEKYIADVFEKVGLAKIAREQSNDNLTNALQNAMIELSKFTPPLKQGEQKSIECSEEYDHWRQHAIDFINHPDLIKATPTLAKHTIDWLKSLESA